MSKTASAGTPVALDLDRASEAPLHRQISEGLRAAVRAGRLPPGARLPSTRALAQEWQVSRNTVLQVFETLVSEGVLDARVGDGTYVAEDARTGAPPAGQEQERAREQEQARGAERPHGGGYPFRGLSQRGRALIAQSMGGLSERPMPFMPDVPDLRAFPIRAWLRLMNEVSGRLTGDILVNVSNAGYEPLREAIAHHVGGARGIACTPQQVIITTGSQQSLDLVARLLLERGDPVWVEEPGYVGARAALSANGCSVMPVPADPLGMDLAAGQARWPSPRMVVVSPSRQYPLGGMLSAERRKQLLAFARATGAWVLEDDYDSDFRYAGAQLQALKAADSAQRVVFIGTFSKTLLPSFRLGYIIVPSDLAKEFARARAVIDRHAPIMEQMVLAEFISRGLYAAHLRRMRVLYQDRQKAMLEVLAERMGHEPPEFETVCGMHFVVPLAPGCDDRAIVARLWRDGVVARPLSMYYGGPVKSPGLLLGFAAYTTAEIALAGTALSALKGQVARQPARLAEAAQPSAPGRLEGR